MAQGDERKRLLDAAIDYVVHQGFTELSLRRLAAELGTSHRMLSHHFGSKVGLWVAIVREVEQQQLADIATLLPDETASYEDTMRAWWRHISDPSLWPNERLFFEVYAQALRGRSPAVELLDGIVESWVEPAARYAIDAGVASEDARTVARLGVAVTRGLLLDLLATGDRTAVDDAMELWISLTSHLLDARSSAPKARRQRAARE